MPPLAISILPDGTQELVDASLLEGIEPDGIILYGEWDQTSIDALTVAHNLEGEGLFVRDWDVEPFPTVSRNIAIQASYLRMRLKGESHNIAKILATGASPSIRTDATFNSGRHNNNQFDQCRPRGEWLKQEAEKAGISITGKYYSSALARFPGDPKAWISGRGDVLRIAKENGMHVSGSVDYTPPEQEPEPDVDVAPDIVAREVDQCMAINPSARRADVEERVHSVLSGQVDNNSLRVQEIPHEAAA